MKNVTVARHFAANLIRCRSQAGISQENLAFAAGCHRTEISLLESGARTPRIDTLVKLAGSMGIEPSELLKGIAWNAGEVRARR